MSYKFKENGEFKRFILVNTDLILMISLLEQNLQLLLKK